MGVPVLDTEFLQYWSQLTTIEKESLLSVAKNYVELKQENISPDIFRKNMIRKEREMYLRGEGVSYSWEEVKDMAINKGKRNGL